MSSGKLTVTSEALEFVGYQRTDGGTFASVYDRGQVIEDICERLALGEPLAKICRDASMPSAGSVLSWAQNDPETDAAIARARELGHDVIALDALQIADDIEGDTQRDKLRVDTRLKLLAKWNPKKYGESTQLRHADADGQKLDTAPLVSELLSLMAPGVVNTVHAPTASATDGRSIKAELMPDTATPRPVYRPRRAHDVDDLV